MSLKFPLLLGSGHGVQGEKDSNHEYLNSKKHRIYYQKKLH